MDKACTDEKESHFFEVLLGERDEKVILKCVLKEEEYSDLYWQQFNSSRVLQCACSSNLSMTQVLLNRQEH